MLDASLRRRLEALNREPLPAPVGTIAPDSARPVHPAFRSHAACLHARVAGPETVRPLSNLLQYGEVVENSGGRHLRIVQPVETLWEDGERLVAARHGTLTQTFPENSQANGQPSPDEAAVECSYRREVRALVASFPDRTAFLDLETCGLAGAALFLVGLLWRVEGRLAVELLLARTYAEEKAVLVSLWERVVRHDVLVTFNGKSFDWPMVRDRSTRYLLNRVGMAVPATHIDILHHARRRWRRRLPDCRLQTLERYVCGRRREGDIPGLYIPRAYQRFVETGDGREMESILFHNAWDLVTLLDLSMRLAGD